MKKHIEINFGDTEKVNQKDLDHLKERCNNWERYRTKSNLNTLTLKQRCSILEMTNAKLVADFKSVIFVNKILWIGLLAISITTLICTIFK